MFSVFCGSGLLKKENTHNVTFDVINVRIVGMFLPNVIMLTFQNTLKDNGNCSMQNYTCDNLQYV